MASLRASAIVFCLAGVFSGVPLAIADDAPFKIRVIDDATGRGVPLVELQTVNHISYVTDSAGIVAFNEPGLMGTEVYFGVRSHGYTFPKDGFGFQGVRLRPEPGKSAALRIRRDNIAERLYRVTGGGIYRDSILVGEPVPIDEPVLNAQVFGSDSVMAAIYRGKIYWFWGDTLRPSYPLGNFHTPAATSPLPGPGTLPVEQGLNLDYLEADDGFAKETARMPGPGPTWIDGVTVLTDDEGRERMFARYVKIKPPMTAYERGLIEFDDQAQEFRKLHVLSEETLLVPQGHPFPHREGGVDYVYFAHPYPNVRVRATVESFLDPSQFEAHTYLAPGSTPGDYDVARDPEGRVRLGWKPGTSAVTPEMEQELVEQGQIAPEERYYQFRDADGSGEVQAHRGSVAWNDYLNRFIMVFTETGGRSFLGEVWIAAADAPTGPWRDAVRVVTHDNYSFYNPKHHSFLDADGGRRIYFEGTYTHTFSAAKTPTPRYDYNQIMYALDLDDERLRVLRTDDEGNTSR